MSDWNDEKKSKPEDSIHWIIFVLMLGLVAFFAMGLFVPAS